MKIAGIVILTIGLIDLIGSYIGFNLWGGFIGVALPDIILEYSSYIEIGLGCFIIKLATNDSDEKTTNAEVTTSEH